MLRSLTIGLAVPLISGSALAGPYSGQDIVDGLSIFGSIAGALGDIAEQANRQHVQEMADWADRCAQRELQVVVNGAKTDADVQNLALLVKNGDIASRVMKKCVGKGLVDAGVGVNDVQNRVVIPSWNLWINQRNASVEKQNEARRAQVESERAQADADRVKGAIDDYTKCLAQNVGVFALVSNERAETVVKAVQGQCWQEAGAYRASVDASGYDGDAYLAKLEASVEPQMIATIVKARAAQALRSSGSPTMQSGPQGTPAEAKTY